LTIEDIDRRTMAVTLNPDLAGQIVSGLLSVAGHAPVSTPAPSVRDVEPPQLIPLTQIGWGKNDQTGEVILATKIGHLMLSFLCDPRMLVEMAQGVVRQADVLTQPGIAPKQ
jgi:hypothetical protein